MSNWGDHLPGDILDVILSKVFGNDRHSFRLVCKHWNTVATTSAYRYSSPCLLMYYYRPKRTCRFYQYNSFFFYKSRSSELENAEVRCSKHGWLLMSCYDNTLFFLDPSNNRKVTLPCRVGDYYTSLCFFNPPTSPECVVDSYDYCLRFDSDKVNIMEQYLVKVKEELFGVFVFEEERTVRVFRLSEEEEMKWDLMVDGIGDKVMYISHVSSFGYKATAKSMENTIYFPMFHGDVPVFYSLSDDKYHSLDGDYSEGNAYGLKRLDLAAWLMPKPQPEVSTTLSSLSWL